MEKDDQPLPLALNEIHRRQSTFNGYLPILRTLVILDQREHRILDIPIDHEVLPAIPIFNVTKQIDVEGRPSSGTENKAEDFRGQEDFLIMG